MTLKMPFHPELVCVFYKNLKILKIPIVVDQPLFYSLTKLSSQGVPLKGTLVDDWKHIYSNHDARKMVCNKNTDMIVRLLAGSFNFECHIMHYIFCCMLLPRSTNLAQASEED